jgi:hypothetical protein
MTSFTDYWLTVRPRRPRAGRTLVRFKHFDFAMRPRDAESLTPGRQYEASSLNDRPVMPGRSDTRTGLFPGEMSRDRRRPPPECSRLELLADVASVNP